MVFWSLAVLVTAAACAALYYAAAGRRVNAAVTEEADATTAHFRLQLKEIDADLAAGRLPEPEAVAARGELARELLRLQAEDKSRKALAARSERGILVGSMLAVAVLTFGIYALLGNPGMPGQPLAGRTAPDAGSIDLADAVERIEAQLEMTPDDVRGWTVIAPVYMQQGRYDDAVRALRRVNELETPTADTETDLAEALMMQAGGSVTEEASALLQSATKRDPAHVRSRFYIAAELTRAEDYPGAVAAWKDLLALSTGSEPWIETAQAGLAAAEAGLSGQPAPAQSQAAGPDEEMIRGMVAQLSERLSQDGGTAEEWTQLVRSYLVLGDRDAAQKAYDAAKAAYRDAAARGELDKLASEAGLK